jgi:GNAT superfamily N-acetyltransferase
MQLPTPIRLSPRDLPAMLALAAAAAPTLPPGFVLPRGAAELDAYLSGARGAAFGIARGGQLLAMALLRLPHPNEAPPPGLRFPRVPAADWPGGCCGMEAALVHPAARGRGFQRALLAARLAHAGRAGARWAIAGTRLANVPSWRNLLAAGFAIVGQRHDMGAPLIGLLRGVAAPLDTLPADLLLVDAADAMGHDAALAAGLVGVALEADGRVLYRRAAA